MAIPIYTVCNIPVHPVPELVHDWCTSSRRVHGTGLWPVRMVRYIYVYIHDIVCRGVLM